MKKILTLVFSLFSFALLAQSDTVRTFEAPVHFRIQNDTIGSNVFGRTATVSAMKPDWDNKTIIVAWRVKYFDLQDSSKNIQGLLPSYIVSQTADKNIFVDYETGENIALSEQEFLSKYGIFDNATDSYKKTVSGNWQYYDPSGKINGRVMDGWSFYMLYSTKPVPFRTMIESAGKKMGDRFNKPTN